MCQLCMIILLYSIYKCPWIYSYTLKYITQWLILDTGKFCFTKFSISAILSISWMESKCHKYYNFELQKFNTSYISTFTDRQKDIVNIHTCIYTYKYMNRWIRTMTQWYKLWVICYGQLFMEGLLDQNILYQDVLSFEHALCGSKLFFSKSCWSHYLSTNHRMWKHSQTLYTNTQTVKKKKIYRNLGF